MFNINDTIIYGTQGVCNITDIVEKKIGGESSKYYVLNPVFDNNSTIFVPMNNEKLTDRMKHILSTDEINSIIKSIPDDEAVWIDNESQRKLACQQIISGGDRLELARMIRGLYMHKKELAKKGKRLHLSDDKYFKEAEKLLFNEFALVLNIKPEQVVSYIFGQVDSE